jgi:ABC-type lipoprotein release transport system permease subunit
MNLLLLLRMAWRNLWRHTRRTVLTALAFATGVFLLVVFLGLGDGMHEKMIETGIRMGSGHVVIEPAGAREKAATDLVLAPPSVAAVRRALASERVAGRVRGSAPRLHASGLLSSASNSTGVQVIGVDAEREARVSLLPDRIVAGEYLGQDGRVPPVVVGRAVAGRDSELAEQTVGAPLAVSAVSSFVPV